jgi:hypothetical protein
MSLEAAHRATAATMTTMDQTMRRMREWRFMGSPYHR